MKKIQKKKLSLGAETIKSLSEDALHGVVGGYPSALTCIGCNYTHDNLCVSVNPCTLGPTHGVCLTYVQTVCL